MTQDTPNGSDTDDTTALAAAISLPYKVLGDIDDGNDGIGVLGRNTAGTGTTRGVEGRVDSPLGYGLATPDDALIEGAIDTGETDLIVEAGTTSTGDATNVVVGHASNAVAGGVVGLRAGDVVADPTAGETALVVSGSPMVTGNVPDDDRESEFVCLALTGQVPVGVRGPVDPGEVLVAAEDGRAVRASESTSQDRPVVGLTLEGNEDDRVRSLVGGHGLDAARQPSAQWRRTDDPAETVEVRNDRIDALERETDHLRTENDRLRERVAAIESHLGVGDVGAPADD